MTDATVRVAVFDKGLNFVGEVDLVLPEFKVEWFEPTGGMDPPEFCQGCGEQLSPFNPKCVSKCLGVGG